MGVEVVFVGIDHHFNSTMVRLEVKNGYLKDEKKCISIPLWFDWKPSTSPPPKPSYPDFNSTMVRLEEADQTTRQCLPSRFQFHYGSIGRWRQCRYQCHAQRISIPLWFDWKNKYKQILFALFEHFNSTMVRLEVIVDRFRLTIHHNFNSTMVRLEENLEYHTMKDLCGFQFHYGSIGSQSGGKSRHGPRQFQFHYGSIGSESDYYHKKELL